MIGHNTNGPKKATTGAMPRRSPNETTGAWVLDITPVRQRAAVPATSALHVFPIRSVIIDYFPWETVPGDRRGRNVARFQVASADPGEATVTDSAGRPVRQWRSPLTTGVNTLTWDMQTERDPTIVGDAPPGRYTVSVRIGERQATGTIELIADPILKKP